MIGDACDRLRVEIAIHAHQQKLTDALTTFVLCTTLLTRYVQRPEAAEGTGTATADAAAYRRERRFALGGGPKRSKASGAGGRSNQSTFAAECSTKALVAA
jgi:hypothetical protein